MHEIRKMIAFTQIKFSWYFRGFTLVPKLGVLRKQAL